MADEKPSLHIDTDWKKQAQEEKRKLAEAAAAKSTTPAAAPAARPAVDPATTPARRRPGARELPAASFASLVQSIMTQVLYHLGDLASAAGAPAMDLDLAKHQIDSLNVLEEKTKNNLSAEEQNILDSALYETRTRFVSVASQLLGP